MAGVSPLITSTDTHCARFRTKLQVENETCCLLHLIHALEEILVTLAKFRRLVNLGVALFTTPI